MIMVFDVRHRTFSLRVIQRAIEDSENLSVDIAVARVFGRLEHERIEPTTVRTDMVCVVDRFKTIIRKMLQHQCDVLSASLSELRFQIRNELSDANVWIALQEKA